MALRFSWRRLPQRLLRRWFFVPLLVGIVFLFLALLPRVLHRALSARLAAIIPGAVSLGDVDLDLLRGGVTLKDLTVTVPGDQRPAITVRKLGIDLALWALWHGHITLEAVSLSEVHIEALQQAGGQLNLTRLLPPADPSAPLAEFPVLRVEQLVLTQARIRYHDHTRTPPPAFLLVIDRLETGEIALRSDGLSVPVTVQLKGQLNESPLHGQATILWQRTQTGVEVHIDGAQLTLAMLKPYLQQVPAVRHGSGQAGGRVRYRYQSGEGVQTVHALDGVLTLRQIRVTDPLSGQAVLDLPTAEVAVEKIDFLAREVRLATVHMAEARVLVLQTATGLNWATLMDLEPSTGPGESDEQGESLWRLTLQEIRLLGGELRYRQHSWADDEFLAVTPEELTLRYLADGTTESPLSFRVRLGDGRLSGAGGLRLSPFSLQLQVQLSELSLASLQPVFSRLLPGARVTGVVTGAVQTTFRITDGMPTVGVSGALDTAAVSVTGFSAAGSELGWQSGRIAVGEGSTVLPLAASLETSLSQLTLRHLPSGTLTIGQATGAGHLAWRPEGLSPAAAPEEGETSVGSRQPPVLQVHGSVEANDVVLKDSQQQIWFACYHGRAELREGSQLLPLALHLEDLVLEYPYGQLVRTNTRQFAAFVPPVVTHEQGHPPDRAPGGATAGPAPFAVQIERATVRGGELFFADHALTPPQMVSWQNVALDVTGARYPSLQLAQAAVRAFHEDGAPIRLHATAAHTDGQTVVKIRGEVERLGLPRLNPYLAPLGYPVRNGALSLRVDLVVPGNRLQANSTLTLHDLGMGSAEGASVLEKQVGLPLSLIVALLKDLDGNINLQIPVRGQLDEPSFEWGGTILRAIRDAVVGAVTSPLKLLGAVLTRKGQIRHFSLAPITFLPGTSRYSEQGQHQLTRLGEFLSQRPELSVQISGYTGPADLEVLQDRLLLAQLQSSSPMPPQPLPSPAPETSLQSAAREEIAQFLAARLGVTDSVPTLSAEAAALLARLRAQVVVPPQDLERLAAERVQQVSTDLASRHAIASSRLLRARGKTPGREGAEVRYLLQAADGEAQPDRRLSGQQELF